MKYAIYSDGSYKDGVWGSGAVILQETPFGFNPVTAKIQMESAILPEKSMGCWKLCVCCLR